MNSNVPPGWYPDPEGQGQQRYWDGSAWTEHRAPMAGGPAVQPGQQPVHGGEPPEKKPNWFMRHKILTAIGGVFLLLGIIGALAGEDTTSTTPSDTSEATASAEPSPSDEPSLSEEPSPSEEQSPKPTPPAQVLDEEIRDALGDINRDDVKRVDYVEYTRDLRVLNVKFALNDNLTEGMIKTGAKIDITDILEAVQDSGVPVKFMNVEATFVLVDNLGNESEDTVVRASYRGNIIKQINFENFLHDNVYDIADDVDIHPAFQED